MATPEAQWRPGESLAAAEKLMLECAMGGRVLDGRSGLPASEDSDAREQGRPVAIRAAVLRHLLAADDWPVDAKGVRLRGVVLRGKLDLETVSVRCPLVLTDCDLGDADPVVADFATIPLLVLERCRLAGFSGDSIAVTGNLSFEESHLSGTIGLPGARIDGALLCLGMRIGANAEGNSIFGHGMNVRLSVHLRAGVVCDGAIIMPRAQIGGEFICHGSRIGANEYGTSLDAPRIRVGGALFLNGGFHAEGAVRLAGANIGGQLSCNGAYLGIDSSANSLICDGLRSVGSVSLDPSPSGDPFIAAGAVRLSGAGIAGSLTCRGAQLGANKYGNALIADELQAGVAVLLERGFTAAGAVRLPGAVIGGQFRCQGAEITGVDEDACSLICAGIKVGGPTHLTGAFKAAGAIVLSGGDFGGTVRLSGAEIGSDLVRRSLVADGIKVNRDLLLPGAACAGGILLTGASIEGRLGCRGARIGADQDQNSLVGGQVSTGGDVTLTGVTGAGAITMSGANIGGLFICRGARLGENIYGYTLNLPGSRIGRDLQLGKGVDGTVFTGTGSVIITSAQISGSLQCEGSVILGASGGPAGIAADGAKIVGSANFIDGFTAEGSVSLRRATIGESLNCGHASLGADAEGNSLLAERVSVGGGVLLHQGFTARGNILLDGATIGNELKWEPETPVRGQVNLEGARVHYLVDEWTDARPLGCWPQGKLRLAGFAYDGFGGRAQATAEQRLNWIRSQYGARSASAQPFMTQPYRQLSDVYRRAGQEDEARAVEIAMRRDMRIYGNLSSQRKAINWVLDITIRYGFNTGRALAAILALYLIVFLAFLAAQHQGSLIEASNLNNTALHPTAMQCVTGYPCFYPAGYAFDTVVPLINIHQSDFWQVNGHHPFGWAWVFGGWVATALGWFLATLLVVGYSGLAKQ